MTMFRAILLLALAGLPSTTSAQYIGGRPPAPPAAPAAGTVESPEAALARNVRLLAISPRNYDALLGAGRAALRLGDAQAAVGFFGRAEEINPSHWAPKAGQASALTQMGEAATALGLFEQAQALGAVPALFALDRGLAYDLLGRQDDAQRDYRLLLPLPDGAEARRRLALSLAISGKKVDALNMLDPLLAQRDLGARRSRALILALGGDLEGARVAILSVMPGVGNGFDPFLRRLPTLGPGQKAAAVHLGMMPVEGAALARAEPPQPASAPPARIDPPETKVASAEPAATPLVPEIKVAVAEPPQLKIAAADPPPTPPGPRVDRLADIEQTLVAIPEAVTAAPPPRPRPVVEKPSPRRVAAVRPEREAAEPKTRAEKAERGKPEGRDKSGSAREGRSAEAKERDKDGERATRPGGSRVYVQLAGGANADRMNREFDRIRARKTSLFKGRQAMVSEVRGWARLLVGPFKDSEAAQEFVNDLHEARLEGFVWTAPGGTKVEKLASK